jgi:hypothetical protein
MRYQETIGKRKQQHENNNLTVNVVVISSYFLSPSTQGDVLPVPQRNAEELEKSVVLGMGEFD